MLHERTVAATQPACPNPTGGRPVRPSIWLIENHVEEIVIVKDDEEMFRRAARVIVHLDSHIEEGIRLGDFDRVLRAAAALKKLAGAMAERSTRLATVCIPELQACYIALEAAVA
jgi:hypothetical protein